ncbi:MAG: type II secretion system F family protein [Bacillota bacterium]|nr:type II secretion system F family protein [Bacillota bacterium]
MYILLIIEIALLTFIYSISKSKISVDQELLGKEDKKLKAFLPMGIYIYRLIDIKAVRSYKTRIESKIRVLHGNINSEQLTEIYLAREVLILVFSLTFLTFVGSQIGLDSSFALFSMTLIAALLYAVDKQLNNKMKERARQLQMDFPEFLSKLILLVNAGLTVTGAISKIIYDCKKDNSLYYELNNAMNEIKTGKPEFLAYEEFARRCRLQEITMFVSILLQNLKKGNDELIPILKLQANTCWENRKLAARKLGEEASTKLLVPMMIIFIAILGMILTPAVLQLNF